jgi:peptide/nickel transport system substrate-binding protein
MAPRTEIVVATDAETLDPRYAGDAVAMRASRLIHAGLVRLDPSTLAPLPYLASGWHWIDARTLHIDLREDVHFHSGHPLTSTDVVATLHAFASPVVLSRHASVVDAIAEARPDGEHAVTIVLRRPHATLVTDLELPILRADQAEGPPDASGALDGLGPYVVAHFSRGEIVLDPADTGATLRPARGVVIRTVHDENARALRLYGGRTDVAVNVISPTLLPALDGKNGLSVTARPGANLTYMVLRVDRPPFDDVRLREALSTAIDRMGIAKTLLAGRADPADTLLPPSHWAYSPPSAPLVFDPPRAKALLDQAALGTQSRGQPRLRFSLLTSTDRLRGTIARYVAQELLDVGIEADIVPLELGTLLARLSAGDFDAATLQLPELTEPNVLRVFLHSAMIPPAGANRGRVRDPVVDALLDEGDATTGETERRDIYARLEQRMRDELFILPLWHEDQVAVTSARARAFIPSAEGRWLSLAGLP